MDNTKLQNILTLVDKNNTAFPENDYLDICRSLMDVYNEEIMPENHIAIPLEHPKNNQPRVPGEEDFYAAMSFLRKTGKYDCLYLAKKLKHEQKEVSRYPLKRITNRVERDTRKKLCYDHDIPYDENSIPTIQKINLLLGSSYNLRDECKKYMKACNDTVEEYKDHLRMVENSFKLKIEQFKEFHETLGKCLNSINYT
ncbi:hypothetical protein [Bathycoccus sp. RCC716 virus 3]|nr:hypothetical protein [Bathycoccus sp. RCC716 virus 3]